MAQRRKSKARASQRRPSKRPPAKSRKSRPEREPVDVAPVPPTETAEQALVGIAQDAVIILRRELAFHAALSVKAPGLVKMKDLVAMLRLLVDLVPEAMKGHQAREADFEALTPEEREQFAGLLGKVIAT